MAKMPQLLGKVCLVTGATRGIGKGIALQLAESGATVYITGRTLKKKPGVTGSLEETAAEVSQRGNGRCIPVQCDHSKDDEIEKLFSIIKSEQNGQLDILVNNAYSAVTAIMETTKKRFWEQPVSMWDDVNNVGLRNHYICSVYAAQLMVPRREGLIVNISSPGGLRYLFNVAYGIGKQALDRMAADCGHELRKQGVTVVSLWPGIVLTEHMDDFTKTQDGKLMKQMLGDHYETTEFTGKAIAHLATDPAVMKKTGRVLLTTDLGDEYGFVDVNGRKPANFRSVQQIFKTSHPWLASLFPSFVKVPLWMLTLSGSKL